MFIQRLQFTVKRDYLDMTIHIHYYLIYEQT